MNYEIKKAKADIDQLKAELMPEKSPIDYMDSDERSLIAWATILANKLAKQGKTIKDPDVLSDQQTEKMKNANLAWEKATAKMKGDDQNGKV